MFDLKLLLCMVQAYTIVLARNNNVEHGTELRVWTYSLWSTKVSRDGQRTEKGVLRHRDPVMCPVWWQTANLFVNWHVTGVAFPDLLGTAWHTDPLFPSPSNCQQPVSLATYRSHVTQTYRNLGLDLDVVLHLPRRTMARELQHNVSSEVCTTSP